MLRRSFLGELASLPIIAATSAVVPVGWSPPAEMLHKLVETKIPIYACGVCSHARGVTDADLADFGAKFGNPKIFVSLIERADRIVMEQHADLGLRVCGSF